MLAAAALSVFSLRNGYAAAEAFDHEHRAWTALLRKHVVLLDGGKASRVRYAALAADRAALHAYLASLSAVRANEFEAFTQPRRMAFLLNAYNAFTIALVLTRYPDLASIKNLGGLFQSPWEKAFISLFGMTLSLDDIEQKRLRAPGRYDDPRIHFAANCASIGCPMLREEAYVGTRLDAQLDEQASRFMADRSRNRWHAARRRLEVSKIFDWYGDDFSRGPQGIASTRDFFARYADLLADSAADRERIRTQQAPVAYLDYDWTLNDAR